MTTRTIRLNTTEEEDALIQAILPDYLRASDVMEALDIDDDALWELMDNKTLPFIPTCGTVVFSPESVGNVLRKKAS